MGKRYKQWKNKARGKAKLENHGRCFHAGCQHKARQTHHCRTCEELERAGKLGGEVQRISFCPHHADEATAAIKQHAIAGHPLPNVPRAIIAGLKGDL